MCRLFISSFFAALLFKKYGMFNIIEQQLHQRFVTTFSMKLSLWNCATILSTLESTIGFTNFFTETSISG